MAFSNRTKLGPYNFPVRSNDRPDQQDVVAAGIWDEWWYFKGRVGDFDGDNAHLWMSDNPDFEFGGTAKRGAVLIGCEPVLSDNAVVNHYGLVTKQNYPATGGSWDMKIEHHGTNPLSGNRRLHWGVYRGGSGLQNMYAQDYKYPFERMVCAGRFINSNNTSRRYIIDNTQSIEKVQWFYGSTVDDSTSRIRIGAQGNNTGPDYSTNNFRGKIYWMVWVQDGLCGTTSCEDLYSEVKTPEEIWQVGVNCTAMCYINFGSGHNPGAATLTPDVQSGPNAPYVFNIYGTPVLNGP